MPRSPHRPPSAWPPPAGAPPPARAQRPPLGPPLAVADAEPDDDAGEDLEALLDPAFLPAQVPSVVAAQAGMAYFTLLRDLVRLGEAGFVVRLAVLTELASSDRTHWDAEVLGRHFSWLTAEARGAVLRSLRRGGWLEVVEASHRLTERGEALYAVISRVLGIQPEEGDLALGVLNVELTRDLGHEQAPALRHLHHNLRRIVGTAEEAARSHSEVRVLEAQARIERNLAWARRARACVERLELGDDLAYRAAQDVGAALSELHQWQAVLQRAIGDLSRKRVQLGATGLSMTDVTTFLMRCDLETLADFGAPLASEPVAPLFLILDNALSEAEYEYVQVPPRPDEPYAVGWLEGPPQDSAAGDIELPEFTALDRFIADVQALAQKAGSQKLATFVPRRSWAESAYRLSLLALGESITLPDGAGATADASGVEALAALASTPFEVVVPGDGSDKDRVFTEMAAEVSRGVVRLTARSV